MSALDSLGEVDRVSEQTFYYFAYGSNMDKEDLHQWCEKRGLPRVAFHEVSPAQVAGYRLSFNHYSSGRKGGAANIMKSPGDSVYGLLMKISDSELETIRIKEGYPDFYDEIPVEVERLAGGFFRDVKTYKVLKALEKSDHQPPRRHYLQLIIRNARKYNFPNNYVDFLQSTVTKD